MTYTIEKIETNNTALTRITQFLQESFPKNKKFTSDFIRWQYAENPIGSMVGFNALENNKIISHFAGLPIEMNLHGSVRKGLLCINVATDEKHRGKKLFTDLGMRTIELAKEEGFDFMIAVPNANSTHGFLKHFGFYLISPLTVKLGIGTGIYDKGSFSCFKTWDVEQLKWRLKNPTNIYACVNKKKGTISSPIAILFKTTSGNIDQKYISKNSFHKIGWRPFNLYIGLGANTSKGIYVNMPTLIKRPPFNLVFKDLTNGDIKQIEKEDIFLQLLDLDTI